MKDIDRSLVSVLRSIPASGITEEAYSKITSDTIYYLFTISGWKEGLPLERLTSNAIKALIINDPALAAKLPIDNLTGTDLKIVLSRYPALLNDFGKAKVASILVSDILSDLPELSGIISVAGTEDSPYAIASDVEIVQHNLF